MGADNARALPRLRRDTQQGMFDAVLHVGEAPARVHLEAGGLGAYQSSAGMGWVLLGWLGLRVGPEADPTYEVRG